MGDRPGGDRGPRDVLLEHIAALEAGEDDTLAGSMLGGIARASAILLGVGDPFERAERAIHEVARASRAHRLQLFERLDEDGSVADRFARRILYQAPEYDHPVVPDPVSLRELGIEVHMNDFFAGHPVDLDAREIAEAHPAHSGRFGHRILLIPVLVDDRPWGALSVVNLEEAECPWTPSQQAVLAALAVLLGSAIERERCRQISEERRARVDRLSTSALEVASLAHDLNNLYAAVAVMVDLHVTDEEDRALVGDVVGRIRALTNGLVDAARDGTADRTPGPVRLDEIVLEAARAVGATTGVRIDVSRVSPVEPIAGFSQRLHELATNLLLNAVESLPERQGRVVATLGTRDVPRAELALARWTSVDAMVGRSIVFEVEDDGVGMSEAALSRLFEPFRTTKATGTGLGMVSILRAVRLHGGAIAIRTQPDRGTTVTVYLPASAPR